MKLDFLTPKYCFIQHFIRFFLIIFLFSCVFSPIIVAKFNKEGSFIFIILFFLIGCELIVSFLGALLVKSVYRNAHFKILDDRVEYYRDFFSLRIIDLKYKNIKEISLTQSPLQRFFGVGTILLQSHASPQSYKGGSSGLKLYDVENPQAIFSFLKKN
ncbi:MAG: PH domain-containing protein [Proteobacteria bacterium]|nr:PH domain-containing protein [Pseudomonadota bacterium]